MSNILTTARAMPPLRRLPTYRKLAKRRHRAGAPLQPQARGLGRRCSRRPSSPRDMVAKDVNAPHHPGWRHASISNLARCGTSLQGWHTYVVPSYGDHVGKSCMMLVCQRGCRRDCLLVLLLGCRAVFLLLLLPLSLLLLLRTLLPRMRLPLPLLLVANQFSCSGHLAYTHPAPAPNCIAVLTHQVGRYSPESIP